MTMNYKLALLVLATLFLTTESIRCYNCMEVSYTIADKKYTIPNEVKCDKNSTYACETNMTACSNVKYKFGLTFTGVAVGRFLFAKPLGLNPNLIELNELKTRVSFFSKLDNGKYCP